MSYYVTNGAGTAWNTAANWDKGVNTPSIHATTSITVTSGGVTSATFTAPTLANNATGVIVPVIAKGTAGTITASLIEAGIAVATATINITSLVASTHVFFQFSVPFAFTTLVAGSYSIKLNTAGASGTTSIAADSSGTKFAYLATDDENAVPGATDDEFYISPNQGAALVMALGTSPSIGSGTTTAIPTIRSWGNAMVLANGGGISWDVTTSRTITCLGNVHGQSGGIWRMGTTASPIPLGVIARLQFDENGTTLNHGFVKDNGFEFTVQSTGLTYRKTTIVSGVGTAASPLVFADSVDWTVGDELVFAPGTDSATNYNETEVRFIVTKNSATSYVVSATSGGAEAALTYTHALSAPVLNVTRQCLIDTTNTAHAWYGNFTEATTTANIDIDGLRVETIGGSTSNKTNVNFATINPRIGTIDDLVVYRVLSGGAWGIRLGNDRTLQSYTWWIGYLCSIAGNGGMFGLFGTNKNYTDFYTTATQGAGFYSGGANVSYTDCHVYGSGIGSATAISGIYLVNATNITYYTSGSHSSRAYGTYLSTCAYITAIDTAYGTVGKNGSSDVYMSSDTSDYFLFDNCLFGSTTTISNYTAMNQGSEIIFNKFNQTVNDHRSYTTNGSRQSTGASLADTTVRTNPFISNTLNQRLAPENATTGILQDFKILSRVGASTSVTGFVRKNATFSTDVVTVSLYLPGLTPGVDTPSDTMNMPDDTAYNVFSLTANYTGTVPLYSTLRITAKSAIASAYAYIADIYNGTNDITALKVWEKGKPSEIMFEQLGDAAATWSVLTSTFTTTGTVGYLVTKLLTVAKFLGLK